MFGAASEPFFHDGGKVGIGLCQRVADQHFEHRQARFDFFHFQSPVVSDGTTVEAAAGCVTPLRAPGGVSGPRRGVDALARAALINGGFHAGR